MEEKEKKKKRKISVMLWNIAAALIFIIGLLVLVWTFLNNGTTTETNPENASTTMQYVYCKTTVAPENAFFVSDDTNHSEHEVKIVFQNGTVETAEYTYTGVFPNNETAESEMSWMHADYNIYMGEEKLTAEDLSPTFTVAETKGIINLYLEGEYLKTSATTKFVFLDAAEMTKLWSENALEELTEIYKSKNFTCETKE